MSSVQLPIAKDVDTGNLIHISERISKEADLHCPYCDNPVIKKAGRIRRHHFAHKNNSNCSVSKETLLHEGAKIYLFKCLIENKDFDIIVPISLISDDITKSILKNGKVKSLTTSYSQLIDQEYTNHYLEKSLLNFRPDIYSTLEVHGILRILAWEIYVTHCNEPAKIEAFSNNGINFVELEPKEDGENSYVYTLRDYNGVTIFDKQRDIFNLIYYENKDEINKIQLSLIEDKLVNSKVKEKLYKIEENYNKKLEDWKIAFNDRYVELESKIKNNENISVSKLEDRIYDFVNSSTGFSASLAKLFSTEISNDITFLNKKDSMGDWINLTSIDIVKGKFGKSAILNNKYYFETPIRFLGSFIETLTQSNYCRLLGNKEKHIIGFELLLPDVKNYKILKVKKKVNNDPVFRYDIDVEYAHGKRSKAGKPYMTVTDAEDEYYVKSIHPLIYSFVNVLGSMYNTKFKLDGENKVVCMKFIGLPNEKLLKEALIDIFRKNIK